MEEVEVKVNDMGECEDLKDIPKESCKLKPYEKSFIATKKSNNTQNQKQIKIYKTQNQIKIYKNNKIKYQKNKVVGYPDGTGKKIIMSPHTLDGPDDHTHAFETEDHEDGEPGKPNTGPGSKRGEKKNGTPLTHMMSPMWVPVS